MFCGYREEKCQLGSEDVIPGRMKEGGEFILNGVLFLSLIQIMHSSCCRRCRRQSLTVSSKGGGDGVDDCFGVIGRKDVGSVWRMYFLGE